MNTFVRTTAVAAAAALAVPFWAVPSAHAAEVSEPAAIGAYFYSAGVDKPEESPAAPPNVTGDNTDGVPPGFLATAVRVPNQTDKMSFLFFELFAVPFDATISSAIVTIPLAEPTPPLTPPNEAVIQRNPAPEKVRVCAAGPEGFNGEDAASFAAAPAVDCEGFSAVGTASADKKSYVFDVTALASQWLSTANNGLAIVPTEEGLASEFQAVFLPFDQSAIAVQYTAAAAEPLPELFTPEVPSFTPDTGFSGDTGSFDSGFSEPATSFEAPAFDAALPEPAPMEAAAPEPDVAPAAPVRNVARATEAPLTPTPAFWIGLLAVAALLGLLSLIMGDARVPVAAAGEQSRLARALQARQSGAARGPRMARPLSV